jgi:hypothetical protein
MIFAYQRHAAREDLVYRLSDVALSVNQQNNTAYLLRDDEQLVTMDQAWISEAQQDVRDSFMTQVSMSYSSSAAIRVPRSNCERRRRCSSRKC